MTSRRGVSGLMVAFVLTWGPLAGAAPGVSDTSAIGSVGSAAGAGDAVTEKDYNVGGMLTLVPPVSYTFFNSTGTVELRVNRIQNEYAGADSGMIKLALFLTLEPISGPFTYWIAGERTFAYLPYGAYYGDIDSTVPLNTSVPNGTYYVYMGVFEYEGTCGSTDGYCSDSYVQISKMLVVNNGVYSFESTGGPATAVEYYWAMRDHYFFSTNPAEIAALDASPPGGWVRTGYTFHVFDTLVAGSVPICRFYIPPLYGDSHYYDFGAGQCDAVAARFPVFVYESPSVAYVFPSDPATGACPAASMPLYKLFNQRADTNHRYTTDTAVRDQMLMRGYVLEGFGPSPVAACGPL